MRFFIKRLGQVKKNNIYWKPILKAKSDATFAAVAELFAISETELNYEWQFLRRLPMDLSTSDSLMMLYTQPEKRALFLCFSMLASKILLMQVGAAEVERSFSTTNRILRSECCRLLPEHVDILIKISIEGPGIPDDRDGTKAEKAALNLLLDKVVNEWKKSSTSSALSAVPASRHKVARPTQQRITDAGVWHL